MGFGVLGDLRFFGVWDFGGFGGFFKWDLRFWGDLEILGFFRFWGFSVLGVLGFGVFGI